MIALAMIAVLVADVTVATALVTGRSLKRHRHKLAVLEESKRATSQLLWEVQQRRQAAISSRELLEKVQSELVQKRDALAHQLSEDAARWRRRTASGRRPACG